MAFILFPTPALGGNASTRSPRPGKIRNPWMLNLILHFRWRVYRSDNLEANHATSDNEEPALVEPFGRPRGRRLHSFPCSGSCFNHRSRQRPEWSRHSWSDGDSLQLLNRYFVYSDFRQARIL